MRAKAIVGGAALATLAAAVLLSLSCGSSVSDTVTLTLIDAAELPAGAGERLRELHFADPRGRPVTGVLREPLTPGTRRAAVVLVAGRETGEQAAAVIAGPLEQVVLALEYPEVLPTSFSLAEGLRRMGAVRRSALRMPGLLRGAGGWLSEQPQVDPGRIALVGVSYGVPFAAAAAPDPRFAGVALHHGGADLRLLLEHNLPLQDGLPRRALARFLAWYLRALEPARYVGRISPRPLLLINAERDQLVPRASAERLLAAARPPVRQIWLPEGHLSPDDTAQMRALADSTLAYFRFLRSP